MLCAKCLRYAKAYIRPGSETIRRWHLTLSYRKPSQGPKQPHRSKAPTHRKQNQKTDLNTSLDKISNIIAGFISSDLLCHFIQSWFCQLRSSLIFSFVWASDNAVGMTGTFYFVMLCASVVSYVFFILFISLYSWQYQWTFHFPVFTESSCFFRTCHMNQDMSHECLLNWFWNIHIGFYSAYASVRTGVIQWNLTWMKQTQTHSSTFWEISIITFSLRVRREDRCQAHMYLLKLSQQPVRLA